MVKLPVNVPLLNDQPCGTCVNYDPIKNALDEKGKQQYANNGWCKLKSIYPAVEEPGQSFPSGVKRANAGNLATPYIVRKDHVEHGCAAFQLP